MASLRKQARQGLCIRHLLASFILSEQPMYWCLPHPLAATLSLSPAPGLRLVFCLAHNLMGWSLCVSTVLLII